MTAPVTPDTQGPALTALSSDEDKLYAELKATLGPRIQVVSLLGRGGMALVFLGRDPQLKRSLAIKVLAPEYAGADVARARFTREAQAAATVTHPNVAAVYDVGELPSGAPYFLMQFVDGHNLGRVVETEGAMAEGRARRVIGEVASALAAAHARGLVHRDIKPANIIIESESKRAVVVDFGISAALDKDMFKGAGDAGGTLTAIGTYVGTPRYTSPEQAAHDVVSGKTDVYSLGIVAFEVLTGRVPFQDTTPMALLAAHIKDVPPPIRTLRPDLDASFATLVDRCLQKDAAARPDAAEVARFLVPEPQAAIEWPPPGLEDLRGQAARVAQAFNWMGVFLALFIVALAIQPSRSTSAWQDFEHSMLWSFVTNIGAGTTDITSTPDATQVWLFVLLVAYAGTAIAFIFVVTRTVRFARSLSHGRRQGYPLSVLAAVARDDEDDTAQLLNRSGPFAVLTPDAQQGMLAARRTITIAIPAGVILTTAAVLVWLVASGATNTSPELVSLPTATLLLSPMIVGALVRLNARIVELRLLGRTLWSELPRISSRKEFIRDWLERARHRAPGRGAAASPIAVATGIVLGAAVLFAFFVIVQAAIIATRAVSSSRGEAGAFSLGDGWYGNEQRLMWTLDTLVPRQLAVRPSAAEDAATVRLLAAGVHKQFGLDRLIPPDLKALPALDGFGIFVDLLHQNRWPRGQQRAKAESASASPWLETLRRFGRGTSAMTPPPYLYRTKELLRERALSGWVLGSQGAPGVSAAIARFTLLLDRGRAAEARALAEDVVRAGRRLLGSPVIEEYERGVSVVSAGVAMLQEYARASGDVAVMEKASEAMRQSMLTSRRRWGPRQRQANLLWAATGNLSDDEEVMHQLLDGRLHPYEQWHAMRSIVTSYCTNSREILFGINPKRQEYLAKAAERGVPRTNEWVEFQSERLNGWMTEPRRQLEREVPADRLGASAIDVIRWVGLTDLHARMKYCATRNFRNLAA